MTNSQKPNKSSSIVVSSLSPQEVQFKASSVWRELWHGQSYRASFGFVFAIFAKIDEVVLAPGELQPLGAERPVKAPFAGVIKDIVVKEGQKVTTGDTLLKFDADVSRKRKETLETQIKLEKKDLKKNQELSKQEKEE